MKKVLAAILAVGIIFTAGCTKQQSIKKEDNPKTESMFICVEKCSYWMVVYHMYTKVMYAVSYGNDNRGIFTLLVNADGTPMIWRE